MYQNYSNDYGRNLRNYATGYQAYNSDDCDEDLEAFSEEVYEEPEESSNTGLLILACVLATILGGVMLFATSRQSAAVLSRAMQERQIAKEYVALVHGTPPESGDWQDLLFKDSRKNKVFVVKKQRAGVKAARLEFNRRSAGETSLGAIRLHTGRSHQIRVQFASRGFPLVGDHKYGSRDQATAPMLFSCRLTFPYHGKQAVFEKYPDWFLV